MTAADQYLLLWKGRQSGPFDIARIQEMLLAGDINRMHQIHIDGRWQILDDFLEKLRGADLEAKRAEEQQVREAATRRQIEPQASQEPANPPLPSPASQAQQGLPAPPFANASPDPFGAGAPFPPDKSRMSGFAVTALVMGVCNLIPFVDFVSWILALVFGHIALSQMNADDSLKGRGLAIAGLAITYFFIVVVTTFVVLCLVNNKPIPIHF
jgi:hypothetical protein